MSNAYLANKTLRLLGPPMPPESMERGFKETIRCNPGQITRIKMKIAAPQMWVGKKSHYVWHCHILEHEEHDMMRQFTVV